MDQLHFPFQIKFAASFNTFLNKKFYFRKMFLNERVDENIMLEVIKRLQRVVMIIKLLVDQVMITEKKEVMIIKLLVDQVMITEKKVVMIIKLLVDQVMSLKRRRK